MEKYLRLLNPKTTNYEAIGGGGFGAITAQDVCLAISYARLTKLQSILLSLYAHHHTFDQIKKIAYSIAIIEENIEEELSIYVALLELFNVAPDYRPSERNRAVLSGVSRMQIQRTLGHKINQFKGKFREELEDIIGKIDFELKKSL